MVEFYADEATQQTLDVKKVILASNMDVRVVVTNIVEEMEDQLVGRKAVEQQEQGKGMGAESIALSESQTLLEDSMPKERGVDQEEIEFIKELVEQLDREEKEDRIAQRTGFETLDVYIFFKLTSKFGKHDCSRPARPRSSDPTKC